MSHDHADFIFLYSSILVPPFIGEPFQSKKKVPKHDYEEKKLLSSTKESRFSKLISKRAILALFFFLSAMKEGLGVLPSKKTVAHG